MASAKMIQRNQEYKVAMMQETRRVYPDYVSLAYYGHNKETEQIVKDALQMYNMGGEL